MHMGHATALAKEAVEEKFNVVVAVGGDGTMNEVAQALMYTQTHLAVVPFGSGNGLARHLGIPMDTLASLQLINNSRVILADACTVNGQPYFCTSGVGFDAHIGYLFAESTSRGFSTYAKTTLREFTNYTAQSYGLWVDGKYVEDTHAFMITFANASQYGNNAYIAPQASIEDGYMDVCIMRPFPFWAVPLIAFRIFNKTADKLPWWSTYRCKTAKVQRKEGGVIHLDGEPGNAGPEVDFAVVPHVLHVRVPLKV